MPLTAELTQQLITAARDEAARRELPPVNICVVDRAAHLAGFLRMDGAILGTIDVAHRKARTAALFEADSSALSNVAHPSGASYTVEHTNGGLVTFGGGVVVRDEHRRVIGAIGVSGASVEEDELIAQAAVARAAKGGD
ncbi:GlcG/HbpS family heme-binding protein [Amycolatopsis sp. CA-161197]|uniref:GlcG/HbpS family heme-binding protein n=1 Tax=Amycolatopsis sp. CA-161197 TaxID=3239922 RepID=UPI003D8B5038